MKIEILGTGCAKCNKLYEAAKEAVAKAGKDAEVVKVEDLAEIMKRGVMVTPALAIDGEVKTAGKVLKPDEIAKMLS
ncbi:MAG: thioredoxin family protein [Candidatus Dadabacteria bacterium]|nr:MAG: thioredoxin family protein [Candidatus Dadabacteria bacterium]